MKFLDFLIVASICFLIPVSFIPSTIQPYIIFAPSFLILFLMYFVLKGKPMRKSVTFITLFIVFAFFATGFKLGISADGILSVSGILIVFLLVMLYSTRDPKPLLKYFVLIFTFYELIILMYLASNNLLFSHSANILLVREKFSWAFPNYFAMLAAIKIGIVLYLKENEEFKTKFFILIPLISFLVVLTSLSRTAIVMAGIIFIIPFIFKKGSKLFKAGVFLVLLIVSPIMLRVMQMKDSSQGTSVSHTMQERYDRWGTLFEVFLNNPILGVGFRSTTEFAEGIGSSHNDFIDILIKGGVVLFLIIYLYFFRRMIKLWERKEFVLLGITVAVLFGGLTQNPLKFLPIITIFSVILAISYSKERIRQEKPVKVKKKRGLRIVW